MGDVVRWPHRPPPKPAEPEPRPRLPVRFLACWFAGWGALVAGAWLDYGPGQGLAILGGVLLLHAVVFAWIWGKT